MLPFVAGVALGLLLPLAWGFWLMRPAGPPAGAENSRVPVRETVVVVKGK